LKQAEAVTPATATVAIDYTSSVRSLSLKANVGWTLWGNLVNALAQWGVLVSLAKLGDPSMVGQYALALAIVSPVVLFSNLQLRSVQTTDVTGQFAFADYFGLRLITLLGACAVLVVILAGAGYKRETALVVVGVGLGKCIDGISDIYYGLLQRYERMDYISWSLLLRSPLSLSALAIAVFATGHVYWGAMAQALVSLLVLYAYDVRIADRLLRSMPSAAQTPLRPRWVLPNLSRIAVTASPLGIVILLISLQVNVPRYFIEHGWGERGLGIFSALAYVSMAGNIVTDAIGQSATPRLAKLYASRDAWRFRKLLLVLLGIGAFGGCAGMLVAWFAGTQVLSLLYRPEYAVHMDVFLILTASAGLAYIASFLGYGMTAARLFWSQLPISILSTLVTAVACFFLVPAHGLKGAAQAMLIVSIIRLVASAAVMHAGLKEISPQVPKNA
jgi:O-antigen/teichoic acid export membrane protein